MTNKEALQAQISNYPLSDNAIEVALTNASVDPDGTYTVAGQQAVETALAGLIFIMCTSVKSVSELDYSLTTKDVSDLLLLRSAILKRWNLADETAYTGSIIQDGTMYW